MSSTQLFRAIAKQVRWALRSIHAKTIIVTVFGWKLLLLVAIGASLPQTGRVQNPPDGESVKRGYDASSFSSHAPNSAFRGPQMRTRVRQSVEFFQQLPQKNWTDWRTRVLICGPRNAEFGAWLLNDEASYPR